MREPRCLVLTLLLLCFTGSAMAAEAPLAVSPGDALKLALVESRCPAFSWGAVSGAKSYELVVYLLGEENEEARPVLRRTFDGSVFSWTPSLDTCLERGGQYAWSVRAIGGKEASDWSPPSLFQVVSGPSELEFEEALQVVREYLAEEATGSVEGSVGVTGSLSGVSTTPVTGSAGEAASSPSKLSVATGDSALQVNGAAVVTTATLAAAFGVQLCLTVDYRYVDLIDGTVLDCNTGKMWLKDASCLGQGTWDDTGTSIFTLVADLNNTAEGLDFGCTDYTEGTYTDWEVPAMTDLCGLWSGTCFGTNLCCAASAGLVDRSFLNPAVGNAAGDGQWAADDAFVGVQSSAYWSASEYDDSRSFDVSLSGSYLAPSGKTNNKYVWPVRKVQ